MKRNNRLTASTALLILGMLIPAFGQAQDTLKTYIFGHSLINHQAQVNITPSNETSVPHWFHFLAEEAGENYAVAGQYGFMGGHARNLPPSAQWGFDSVAAAWNDNVQTFADADFDNIMVTPGNFMQWQGPAVNYWNDTISPLGATNTVFDYVNAQEDSLVLYVYENWPDMAGYLANGFPPTQTEWNNYNTYLNGHFHDWFIEYHDSLMLAHPNHCVRMIPTGPVISGLLSQSPFNQIAIDTLYEDDAPHGRPTIYFLAALVTYMAMYEQPAPLTYTVDPIIDPIVANNYAAAVTYIWNELQAFNDAGGNSRVFCQNQVLDISETHPIDESLQTPIEEELILYPNPTTGLLSIRGSGTGFKLEVLDLAGRRMNVPQHQTDALDLSALADGMYLVRVINTATGATSMRRILKQR